jgi:hypothetical protein
MNPAPSYKFIFKVCSIKISSWTNEILMKYLSEEGAG